MQAQGREGVSGQGARVVRGGLGGLVSFVRYGRRHPILEERAVRLWSHPP